MSRSLRALQPMASRAMSLSTAVAGPSRLARIRPAVSTPAIANLQPQRVSLHARTFASTATAPLPSDPSSTSDSPPPEPEPEPKSAYARFKLLTKKYGWWALGMYTALSSIDFTLSFLVVHAFGAERIAPVLEGGIHQYRRLRFGEEEAARLGEEAKRKAEEDKRAEEAEGRGKKSSGWGSRTFWAELMLAYAIHKTALLPFRAGLTVAWTPKFVNWLASRGWIGKGGFGRAATHAQGKIKTASERIKDRKGKAD